MPETEVVMYAEDDGSVPALDWLDQQPRKVQDKFVERIERLAAEGHELRRPLADYLDDKVYELRVRFRTQNYRMLYFFSEGRAVVSHGTVKESKVPAKDIALAARRRKEYDKDPARHAYVEQMDTDNEETRKGER